MSRMTNLDPIRIAVPNKGSLAEPAIEMLIEAGYRQRRDSRELVLSDPDNDAEFFYLRPRDIAVYVGSGQLDLGITGEDLLLDSGAAGRRGHVAGLRRFDLSVRRSPRPGGHRRRSGRPPGGHGLPRRGRQLS